MEEVLLKYGLAGVVILVLGGVVAWQQARIDKLQREKDELQEKRYVDLMELKDKYAEVMSGFSQTADLLYTKLSSNDKKGQLMLLFNRKKNRMQERADAQEKKIEGVKKDFHKKVDTDLEKVRKINKVLSNGVTLQVFHAVGGKHGR